MILLAALLVAVAATLIVVSLSLAGLGWLYAAIASATVALMVLALGVVRELRHREAPGEGRTSATEVGRDDDDPGEPPG
jgi:membrane protein implicated in regulation of membrane protease activity